MKKLPGTFYFTSKDFPLALRKVDGGSHLSHENDYTGIPHYHDFSELVIITGGKGIQCINHQKYPVSKGDVFMMLDKTTHYFTDYQDLQILNIMFDRSLCDVRSEYLRKIPGYHMIFRIEPAIRAGKNFPNTLHLNHHQLGQIMEIVNGMESEMKNQEPGFEADVIALFMRMIVFLSRSVDTVKTDRQAFQRLSVLLSKIEAHFMEPWNLDTMAESANMSVNNFLRVFKAAAGYSPVNYLNRIRLDAAKKMLRENNGNVTDIAFRCGFRDSNYFSKCFYKLYGITPKRYQESHCENNE